MTDTPLVLVERYGARGELVLNRPERRNALIGPLVEALHAGLDELVADDAIHVILLRGAGGSFCAGLDLDAFAADPAPAWRAGFSGMWANLHTALYACPKPTVVALEGAAIAGGSGLALAGDMLIAGEHCRLHVAEVKFGMAAPLNTIWLQLKFGTSRALELAVGGQPFDGPALVQRGIAIKSVPDDAVLAEARAYADLLAQNKPAAMAAVKRTIRTLAGVEDFRALVTAAQSQRPAEASGPGQGLRR
ncbi:MAG: enoyl-CoA hydratase/isomerase family protein [Dehalococcoidia bacterium]